MYLREIAVHADRDLVEEVEFQGGFVSRFHRETLCVSDHLAFLLSKRLTTPKTSKVALKFTRAAAKVRIQGFPYSVVEACQEFDFPKYLREDTLGKKVELLNSIEKSLRAICAVHEWDYQTIKDACNEIRQRKFEFTGLAKKTWVSPGKKFRVRIRYSCDLQQITLSALVSPTRTKAASAVIEVVLGTLPPVDGWYIDYLSTGSWVSETQFKLSADGFVRQELVADIGTVT